MRTLVMRMIRVAALVLVLVLAAGVPQSTSASTNDSSAPAPTSRTPERGATSKPKLALFSKAYAKVHPDWRRGGAWMFHDDYHPCERFGNTCVLSDAQHQVGASSSVHFHVNMTIVPHLGFVNVSFTLPKHLEPQSNDSIAVYCVAAQEDAASARVGDLDFFDYVYVHDTRTIMRDARHGAIVFGPLANQRCSYQFRYLQSTGDLIYRSVGESAFVEMLRGHSEPIGVHVALTNRSDALRVMWTTGRVTAPQVRFGPSLAASASYETAVATTTTYSAGDMCDGLAKRSVAAFFRHPGYLHDALLTGLEPGERYSYSVGSADGVWSDPVTFEMAPAAGAAPSPSAEAQSFFVFGDLGESVLVPSRKPKAFESFIDGDSVPTRAGSVMDLVTQDFRSGAHAYVAVLHVGDLSYARGRTFLWDQFSAMVAPVASRLPYMVAIGNHEYDYWSGGDVHDVSGAGATNGWHPPSGNYGNDSSGECGVPAAKRFHMPETGNQLFWYSFAVGLTHHVVISSEHDVRPASPMREWLERELARVDRAKTPWLFLSLHRPMYCSQKYKPDYDVSLLLRDALEPLLRAYRVDAVFGGHYHAYERTCAVLDGACQSSEHAWARAPVHFMVGSAGATLDDAEYWRKPWSMNVQSEYGYGRLHVVNATHAQWEFVRARGRVVSDSVWLRSTHDW